MLYLALITYLGVLVGAATWFYWVIGVLALIAIIKFGVKLYDQGKKAGGK